MDISLYFHVPFCTRKCDYCHFYVIPDKDSFKKQYLIALRQEWNSWLPALKNKRIVSIYFGGGTPSLLGAEAIGEILSWVQELQLQKNIPEITLEANPENITLNLMQSFAQVGINRVSIGIQSLNSQHLSTLGRLHSSQKAINAVWLTHEAGITNISIDLMYDLPGQTLKSWQETLVEAHKLPIAHLSLYNLTIEPHTVFFKYQETIRSQQPDSVTSLKMHEAATELWDSGAFKQYEISAFCRNDLYSRHNVGYWTGRPFLGMGPSAFSYWEKKRFRNIANLNRYSKALQTGESPIDFTEELSAEARKKELLVLHLRLMEGVDLEKFEQAHEALDTETQKILSKLCGEGLLNRTGHRLSLSRRGRLLYDEIASELI